MKNLNSSWQDCIDSKTTEETIKQVYDLHAEFEEHENE